jgi:predicted nucleic acid-binding protein
VRERVLDASVVLKWFRTEVERGSSEARKLRREYEAGQLLVVVPSLLFLEVLNVAGRRWGLLEAALQELAAALQDLGFEVGDAALDSVAHWVARGLTAYGAAYVALAQERGLTLVTDDRGILSLAERVADPLCTW